VLGLVTATDPVGKGSLTPGLAFALDVCTRAALCSPTPPSPTLFPHSCCSHAELLLPVRTVNPASYPKASEPLNLMVSTADVNINWT